MENHYKTVFEKKNLQRFYGKTDVKVHVYTGFLVKNRYKWFAAVFNKTIVKLCSAPNNIGFTIAANWEK
jgi:menaquinone-dependent protoporphyrinogen IX oxidase